MQPCGHVTERVYLSSRRAILLTVKPHGVRQILAHFCRDYTIFVKLLNLQILYEVSKHIIFHMIFNFQLMFVDRHQVPDRKKEFRELLFVRWSICATFGKLIVKLPIKYQDQWLE